MAAYNAYILATHAATMTPVVDPVASYDALHPPVGTAFDSFIDDHISWDCTSPLDCDKAAAGKALTNLGSRVQWLGNDDDGWTAYSCVACSKPP